MYNNKHYLCTILFYILFSQLFSQTINDLQDLQKMKLEYERIQREQNQKLNQSDIGSEIDITTGLPKEVQIQPYKLQEEYKDSIDLSSKYFGYNFFVRRDSVAFWENLPTPANYLLGPGDELIISIWGETQLRKNYIISRDGKIYDEKVGLLNLMGKTIEEVKKYLINQFGRVYATLRGNNPTAFMDISLGQLRSINVNFVGEVKYPGVYPIHPFSTVITGLIQAGGIDTTGSLRNISIKRNGKTFSTIDIYNYLLKGDIPRNIQLRDQDIVIVPVRINTVIIDSAVVRPGIYESIANETIKQMIDYAGGVKITASSSISLKRIIPLNERNPDESTTQNYYIDYSNSQLTPVQNGDNIIVRSIFKTINQVEIIGQVKTPGIYHFSPGMRLKDLIDLGGGFYDTTFWKSIYKNQGEIVRRNPNTRYETVIKIDLNDVINGGPSSKIMLQNLDRFVVHANLNFFERKNVQIVGEINIPGSYPLTSDNETLSSLLNRAGGFTSKALYNGISIFRDKTFLGTKSIEDEELDDTKNIEKKIRVAWQNESITLMPGDSIVVKESSGTVNISGEVYNPGLIEFRKGKSLRHYINAAGGITINGDYNSVIVIYANGVVSPKKWYVSPKIEDGATIVVNMKEIEAPFNPTQFASNWTSIITSMITAIILSRQLSSGTGT